MAKKRYYGGKGGMISENMSATANLPQNVIMRKYKMNEYAYYMLDDTITGVDRQMNSDVKGMKRYKSKSKY